MRGYHGAFLQHLYLVGVVAYRNLLQCQPVRHGVVCLAYGDDAVVVHLALHQLEAAEVIATGAQGGTVLLSQAVHFCRGLAPARAIQLLAHLVEVCLCLLNAVKTVPYGECLLAQHLDGLLHGTLLIPAPGVAEAPFNLVEVGKVEQGVRGMLLAADEGLHGHAHIVVDHSHWYMPDVVEIIAVGFLEGQCVLTDEEIPAAVVAVRQGESGHPQLHPASGYTQLHLAPVKLAFLTCGMELADEALMHLASSACQACPVVTGVCRHSAVADVVAHVITKDVPHLLHVHALLAVAFSLLTLIVPDTGLDEVAGLPVQFRALSWRCLEGVLMPGILEGGLPALCPEDVIIRVQILADGLQRERLLSLASHHAANLLGPVTIQDVVVKDLFLSVHTYHVTQSVFRFGLQS